MELKDRARLHVKGIRLILDRKGCIDRFEFATWKGYEIGWLNSNPDVAECIKEDFPEVWNEIMEGAA
jgi:hypothetical protein